MSALTTHVLDLATGFPARGVAVRLELFDGSDWETLADRRTDDDGRVKDFLAPGAPLIAGRYRITFAIAEYLAARGENAFFPEATVTFAIDRPTPKLHVPLLLSPFGWSTYRGS